MIIKYNFVDINYTTTTLNANLKWGKKLDRKCLCSSRLMTELSNYLRNET